MGRTFFSSVILLELVFGSDILLICFHTFGIRPLSMQELKIDFTGATSSCLKLFKVLLQTPSVPRALAFLALDNSLLTSSIWRVGGSLLSFSSFGRLGTDTKQPFSYLKKHFFISSTFTLIWLFATVTHYLHLFPVFRGRALFQAN